MLTAKTDDNDEGSQSEMTMTEWSNHTPTNKDTEYQAKILLQFWLSLDDT